MDAAEGNGRGPRPSEERGGVRWGANALVCESEAGLTQTRASEMMDGVRGQEWRRKSWRGEGGEGKMCSDESEEWHEKEAE